MGTTASVFSSATSLISKLPGADDSPSNANAANAQAESFGAEAARKEIEAARARQLGALDQAEAVRQGRKAIAERRAGYAASGVSVNSGSAVEVAADMAAWSEYERQKIESDAAMESWGLKYDAALLRRKAGSARAAGTADAKSSSGSDAFGKHLMNTLNATWQ